MRCPIQAVACNFGYQTAAVLTALRIRAGSIRFGTYSTFVERDAAKLQAAIRTYALPIIAATFAALGVIGLAIFPTDIRNERRENEKTVWLPMGEYAHRRTPLNCELVIVPGFIKASPLFDLHGIARGPGLKVRRGQDRRFPDPARRRRFTLRATIMT